MAKAEEAAETVAKGVTAGVGGQAHNPTVSTKPDDGKWIDAAVKSGLITAGMAETLRRGYPNGVEEYVAPTPAEQRKMDLRDAAGLVIATSERVASESEALDRVRDKKAKALLHVTEVEEQIAYHEQVVADAVKAEEAAAVALNVLENTPFETTPEG